MTARRWCLVAAAILVLAVIADAGNANAAVPGCQVTGNRVCGTDLVTMKVSRLQELLLSAGVHCIPVRRGGDVYLERCIRVRVV